MATELSASGAVRPIDPLQQPDWDAQISRHPNGTFFHGSAWTKVLSETYGFTPRWFAAENSLLPLMEVESWLTGRRGIALPFTDECEPLCVEGETFQRIFQSAIEFGKNSRWNYIECRGGKRFFCEAPASLTFYGHSLDLTANEDELFTKMDGSARQAVRKAEKAGVTVAISQSLEAMQDFYFLQFLF